jgi:hypothetical protein
MNLNCNTKLWPCKLSRWNSTLLIQQRPWNHALQIFEKYTKYIFHFLLHEIYESKYIFNWVSHILNQSFSCMFRHTNAVTEQDFAVNVWKCFDLEEHSSSTLGYFTTLDMHNPRATHPEDYYNFFRQNYHNNKNSV